MTWHLTIGETAFLAPAGVVLGATVSYFAVRKSAKDNLDAQKLAIAADRELARESRRADELREKRSHQGDAYAEVAGTCIKLKDLTFQIQASARVLVELEAIVSDWPQSYTMKRWAELHFEWAEALDRARAQATIYASAEVRKCLSFIFRIDDCLRSPDLESDGSLSGENSWTVVIIQGTRVINTRPERLDVAQFSHAVSTSASIIRKLLDHLTDLIRYEMGVSEELPDDPPFALTGSTTPRAEVG